MLCLARLVQAFPLHNPYSVDGVKLVIQHIAYLLRRRTGFPGVLREPGASGRSVCLLSTLHPREGMSRDKAENC
jgi:hypothetical protein